MEKFKGFDFQGLQFDQEGTPQGTGIADLAALASGNGVTDVILFCHGFRNDENDARRIYGGFLDTLAQNMKHPSLGALAGRKIAVGGVFWPSMVFAEADDAPKGTAAAVGTAAAASQKKRLEGMKTFLAAADRKRVDKMISLIGNDDEKSQTEMVKQLLAIAANLGGEKNNEFKAALAKAKPDTLRQALSLGDATVEVKKPKGGASTGIPTLAGGGAATGTAQGFLGKTLGFGAKFTNLASFLVMFDRCAVIGAIGIAAAARAVAQAAPNVKIHLIGHSLGGRAVTSCAKTLLRAPKVQPATMMLLQAAYSQFGLAPAGTSAQLVTHPRGFFRDVVEKKAIAGAILATHSDQDTVVGFAYAGMSQMSGNNAAAFGDSHSPFGGIGRNGVLDTPEVVKLDLQAPGTAYGTFDPAKITTLNGSVLDNGKARIQNHGDVMNANVTWAFASLLAQL